jgi:hypothetical protein
MTGTIPKSVLRIQGDPTLWALPGTEPATPPWSDSSDPVVLQVIGPLVGTLILSPRRAGSLALVPPPLGPGWVPTFTMVSPFLYIPSADGVASPGYVLDPPDTDLGTLQQDIVAAMRDSTVLTVSVSSIARSGVVILNGAELPFAVIGQAESNA